MLTSCSTASVGDQASADEFWASLRITGDEVEGYSSLGAMKQASDAVIVGRFVDIGVSRQLQGDAEEDVVTYGKATVAVAEVVSGSGVDSTITLEFPLNVAPDGIDTLVQELRSTLPTAPMVLFLREKREPAELDLYRIVNGDGLWVSTDRGIETPLSGNVDVATSNDPSRRSTTTRWPKRGTSTISSPSSRSSVTVLGRQDLNGCSEPGSSTGPDPLRRPRPPRCR